MDAPSSVSEDDGGGVVHARVQFSVLEVPLRLEGLWVRVQVRVSDIRPIVRRNERGSVGYDSGDVTNHGLHTTAERAGMR